MVVHKSRADCLAAGTAVCETDSEVETEKQMPRGLGVEDLPEIYRQEYLHAVEMAKAHHDPADEWDAFVELLWQALVPAFGLDVEATAVGDV